MITCAIRNTLSTLALFAFVAPAVAAEGPTPLADQLEAKLKAMECPGALVGVFPDGGEPQRFVLGVADVESKSPMTTDMNMRIGSVTKPFLAVVVLQLCDEGKLSLDDPLSKYVPDVPGGDQITLRMLGNNTSGLFSSIQNKELQFAIMRDPTKQWTPAEILAYNKDQAPYNAPGERWRYSNTNAVYLAKCVEKVTGRSWDVEIEARVCRPLGMAHTAMPREAEIPQPHPRLIAMVTPTR